MNPAGSNAIFFMKRGMVLLAACLFFCLAGKKSYGEDEILDIRYPKSNNVLFEEFDNYFVELLRLALNHEKIPYTLTSETFPFFLERRSENFLVANRYDVHWLNTNNEREEKLLPIRIPAFKGLIGWRIFFIRRGEQARFADITALETLKKMPLVQGHDWPDTTLLRSNGFTVHTASERDNLFKMLDRQRAEYFPRSVIEILDESLAADTSELEVEKHIALRYPAAYYFFVSKQNPTLAKHIENGLEAAIADGSFEALFQKKAEKYLKFANFEARKVFELNNPELPPLTPIHRPELWYRPFSTPK